MIAAIRGVVFQSFAGYQHAWLSGDVVAGLTVWAVLVPEALAYATVAGVSPIVGLYAAPPALLLYAAFGSSRHLVVGPMSATAALSAATVAEFAASGDDAYVAMTLAVAIIAGLIGCLAALAKLGFVANFISEPVLKGFIIGLALTIIAGQLPSLFGVEKGDGNFFEKIWDLIGRLGETNEWSLIIGLTCLAAVLVLRRAAERIPGSLVAVAIGIGAVVLFNADEEGVAIVGQIDSGLPDVGLPSGLSGSEYLDLIPGTIGILLVGFAEGLGAAKNYAAKNGYEIDAGRELFGLGAANLASGLAGGMVVNGSLSKTAVNGGAGGKSQLSGLVVAVLTVLTFLFLTGLFEELPEATLAAVVIAALIDLVDFPALVRLYKLRTSTLHATLGPAARADFLAAAAALAGVLVFDTLPGLFIGITTSMVLLLYRAYKPRLAVLGRIPGTEQYGDVALQAENQQLPGIVIVRVESGLFFANADRVRQEITQLASKDGIETVILDAETIAFMDVTAAGVLLHLGETLRQSGRTLVIARDIGQVREVLASAADKPAAIATYGSVAAAVQHLQRADGRESP
jgi:high affinity sulfate transporter 1